jgi:hypothetical protein
MWVVAIALWDLMRVVAIAGGVAGGVGVVTGGREVTSATWIAGAIGLVFGGISLPLSNALLGRVLSERGLAVLYVTVFLATTVLCCGAVVLVSRAIAA